MYDLLWLINCVHPIELADSDEHVLFSSFACRWDNDVMCKNCARDDGHNKLHDLMIMIAIYIQCKLQYTMVM